jgi:hypothetical protein
VEALSFGRCYSRGRPSEAQAVREQVRAVSGPEQRRTGLLANVGSLRPFTEAKALVQTQGPLESYR